MAPHDQYFAVSSIGGQNPPFQPGPVFPLGSDQLGRDVLSWILVGARPTLLLVVGAAALRLALARAGQTVALLARAAGAALGAAHPDPG